MQAWEGRKAVSESAGQSRLTWDEWYARQQRILDIVKQRQGDDSNPFSQHMLSAGKQRQGHDSIPFSDRELARLSFVRWLYHSGRLDATPVDSYAENETA